MPSKPDPLAPPEASKGDYALGVAKAGLSAIPVVGGPVSELLSMVIIPPLARRRDEWMAEVAEALSRAEATSRRLDELANDEVFVSTVMQASQAALRTHDAEKRRALRNAVLSAASRQPPGDVLQTMFVALIDDFTAWHLRILALFADPTRLATLHELHIGRLTNGPMAKVLEGEFPEFRGHNAIYVQAIRDLYQRGLLDESADAAFGHMRDARAVYPSDAFTIDRSTPLGKQFLAFISDPA